ncbi:piggyBac transposable element-derived protein 4-like [Schistocerca americana]|uniref:piggyBac transposable element-derived protein 4-like n=1 Tax=Schistocerca americana TaxID=7009 RepID=UPI001F4F8ABF|nr:piggyBac transposable element-derived protein 4-like [Schistocerca americana]
MPMKPVKRGYKVWCLADASTGFIINFDIYTGKRDTNNTSKFTLGEEVVLTLTKAMDGSNRLVAFHNYFTTVRIMEEVQSHGLYGIGTVRPNRKDLPDMLKKNSKLSRGEFEFAVRSCVAAVKWQDSKPVRILSNYHNPKHVTTVLRRNKDGSRSEVFCPLAVAEYNKIMGGVDRFDQLRERYAVGRRSWKWWHRLFFFLVDLAVVNSYVMWKLQKTEADQLTFRLHLARQLISGFSSRKRRGRPVHFQTPKRGVSGVPDEVRLEEVGTHFPTKVFSSCDVKEYGVTKVLSVDNGLRIMFPIQTTTSGNETVPLVEITYDSVTIEETGADQHHQEERESSKEGNSLQIVNDISNL